MSKPAPTIATAAARAYVVLKDGTKVIEYKATTLAAKRAYSRLMAEHHDFKEAGWEIKPETGSTYAWDRELVGF